MTKTRSGAMQLFLDGGLHRTESCSIVWKISLLHNYRTQDLKMVYKDAPLDSLQSARKSGAKIEYWKSYNNSRHKIILPADAPLC